MTCQLCWIEITSSYPKQLEKPYKGMTGEDEGPSGAVVVRNNEVFYL